MRRCFLILILLPALLAGCNSTEPARPQPIVGVPPIEPLEPAGPGYVAPRGMSRAQVYALLEDRSRATNEALEAKEEQERQEKERRRSEWPDIYLGGSLYWYDGYCGPYYHGGYHHGHCWPWYGHYGVYHGHW